MGEHDKDHITIHEEPQVGSLSGKQFGAILTALIIGFGATLWQGQWERGRNEEREVNQERRLMNHETRIEMLEDGELQRLQRENERLRRQQEARP